MLASRSRAFERHLGAVAVLGTVHPVATTDRAELWHATVNRTSCIVRDYFDSGPAGASAWRDRFVEHLDELRIIGTDEHEWLAGEAAFAALADESAHLEAEVRVVSAKEEKPSRLAALAGQRVDQR